MNKTLKWTLLALGGFGALFFLVGPRLKDSPLRLNSCTVKAFGTFQGFTYTIESCTEAESGAVYYFGVLQPGGARINDRYIAITERERSPSGFTAQQEAIDWAEHKINEMIGIR